MSRAWARQRQALFGDEPLLPAGQRRRPARARRSRPPARGARSRGETRAAGLRARVAGWPWPGLLAGLVVAALGFSALRNELVRLQYVLGTAAARETQLRQLTAESAAEVRALRHPNRLREEAKALGFAPPERVVEMPPEAPGR